MTRDRMALRFTSLLFYLGDSLLSRLPMASGNTGTNEDDTNGAAAEDEQEMIIGLAAGLGFFIGLILFICIIWCCCCVSKDDKVKIVPSSAMRSQASSARSRVPVSRAATATNSTRS